MALYQRGRVWYADFYANGKRVQESTGTTNRREAEKFLALRTAEIERGEYARPVKSRFPSLVSGISSMRRPTSDHGSGMNRSWFI